MTQWPFWMFLKVGESLLLFFGFPFFLRMLLAAWVWAEEFSALLTKIFCWTWETFLVSLFQDLANAGATRGPVCCGFGFNQAQQAGKTRRNEGRLCRSLCLKRLNSHPHFLSVTRKQREMDFCIGVQMGMRGPWTEVLYSFTKIWKQISWVCGFWNVFIEWLNSEQALSRAGMVKEQIECPGEEGGGAWEPWDGYIVYLLLKAMACLTSVMRSQWQVASQPNYNLWALSFFKSFNPLGDLYKVWNLYELVRTNPNPPNVWMSLDKYFQHLVKLDLSFFKPTSIWVGLKLTLKQRQVNLNMI